MLEEQRQYAAKKLVDTLFVNLACLHNSPLFCAPGPYWSFPRGLERREGVQAGTEAGAGAGAGAGAAARSWGETHEYHDHHHNHTNSHEHLHEVIQTHLCNHLLSCLNVPLKPIFLRIGRSKHSFLTWRILIDSYCQLFVCRLPIQTWRFGCTETFFKFFCITYLFLPWLLVRPSLFNRPGVAGAVL